MATGNEYVLGAHDDEVDRLRLQHELWRPSVLDLWHQAGVSRGQTILDLGCGPGFATIDLAAIAGSSGRVIAVDRSKRFLDVLRHEAAQRGLGQIETCELDLNGPLAWPVTSADVAWERWGLAFVDRPRDVLASVAGLLRPGGRLVIQEYFAYETWCLLPRSAHFDAFVQAVIRTWREAGGEPDIAGPMLGWLQELDFTIETVRPVVHVLSARDRLWRWPRAFVDVGLRRLVELGAIATAAASDTWSEFLAREGEAATRMMTPLVLQIVARKDTT